MQHVPRLTVFVSLILYTSWASGAELTGVVRDSSGETVAGVPVKLLTSEFSSARPLYMDETTTDGEGRFRVTVPPDWKDAPQVYRQELTLLAGSGDAGVGAILVSRNLPLPNRTLQITLEAWLLREVELIDADGSPMRDVQMKLSGLLLPVVFPQNLVQAEGYRQLAPIPLEDISPLEKTDTDGIVRLMLPPIEAVGSLEADLGEGVTVTWSVHSNNTTVPADWSQSVQVPDFIEVPLHVAAASDEALRDLTVRIGTTPRASYGPTTTIGQTIEFRDGGSTAIRTISEAILYFYSDAPGFPDWRLDRQFLENSSAVGEGGIELNFREAIVAGGRVVDGEGVALPDVNVFVMSGASGESARTDEDGRFEFPVAPGQQLVVLVADANFRGPPPGPESMVMVPPDAEAFTLPDVVVGRLRTVTGQVNDGSGRPVMDASVLMIWDEPHPQASGARYNRQETVQTDDDGRFHMAGVDPEATLRIAAWNDAAASAAMLHVPSVELEDPLEIVISTESLIAARGRVIDQGGAGIPNLPIVLRQRVLRPIVDATSPVGEDILELTTDDDGRFTTPRTIRPWGEYIAVIRPGTPQQAVSGWRPAGNETVLQLPEIVTSPSTEFTGRVVTTSGDPVPAAAVQLLTSIAQSRATTDDSGRFKIDTVAGKGPLLIASADGFSFNGLELRDPSRDIVVVLSPAGEPAPNLNADLSTDQPPAWSARERRDLAVRLYESLANSDPTTRAQALASLARIDGDYVIERLEELPANNSAAWQIRRSLAMAMAEDRPAEAVEIVEQIPESGMRLYILLAVEPRAGLDDDERRELLARILQDGRGVASADHRVMSLGLVGERLLDLGERESGEALLREGHELAQNLAPAAFSGYVRGAFAEELAQVDADAALALIEPLTDLNEYNRHLTNIAHELAAIDPARAVEALDLMHESQTNYIVDPRDGAVIRACYRMVRVDPDRAIALAGTVESDVLRVHCLGVMVDSLLAQDEVTADSRVRAAGVLSDAWDILNAYPDSHDQSEVGWLFPSSIAALLLPATAELFPGELPSRIWQTIALRRPMATTGAYIHSGSTCCSEIAVLLADIDPIQSRRVAAWLPDNESGKSVFEYFIQFARTSPELIAATTPDRIETYLAALEDEATRNRVTLAFIAALSRTGESRQRAIRHDMGLWFPDDEDLGAVE